VEIFEALAKGASMALGMTMGKLLALLTSLLDSSSLADAAIHDASSLTELISALSTRSWARFGEARLRRKDRAARASTPARSAAIMANE
jgi:hypothetical protein